jgi:hypothetical protein
VLSFQAKIEIVCRKHPTPDLTACEACQAVRRLEFEFNALRDRRERFLQHVTAVLALHREQVCITRLG